MLNGKTEPNVTDGSLCESYLFSFGSTWYFFLHFCRSFLRSFHLLFFLAFFAHLGRDAFPNTFKYPAVVQLIQIKFKPHEFPNTNFHVWFFFYWRIIYFRQQTGSRWTVTASPGDGPPNTQHKWKGEERRAQSQKDASLLANHCQNIHDMSNTTNINVESYWNILLECQFIQSSYDCMK